MQGKIKTVYLNLRGKKKNRLSVWDVRCCAADPTTSDSPFGGGDGRLEATKDLTERRSPKSGTRAFVH